MKIILGLFLPVCLLVFAILGCSSSPEDLAKQNEIRKRKDFASRTEDEYRKAFRVLISAQGEQKDTLEISVIETVSPYDAPSIVELYSTDELKKEAKALKFKQIYIKGGGKSFGDPDTINKSIDLRWLIFKAIVLRNKTFSFSYF